MSDKGVWRAHGYAPGELIPHSIFTKTAALPLGSATQCPTHCYILDHPEEPVKNLLPTLAIHRGDGAGAGTITPCLM